MITIEAAVAGRLLISIGAQSVCLHPDDVADLARLAGSPDGTVWSQAVYTVVEGSTVRTVLAHRHGQTVTIAIGLDGEYTAARLTADRLTATLRTMRADAESAR